MVGILAIPYHLSDICRNFPTKGEVINGTILILLILLGISLLLNVFLWYRWHSYRGKPAGGHSYTGMMPKAKQDDNGRE